MQCKKLTCQWSYTHTYIYKVKRIIKFDVRDSNYWARSPSNARECDVFADTIFDVTKRRIAHQFQRFNTALSTCLRPLWHRRTRVCVCVCCVHDNGARKVGAYTRAPSYTRMECASREKRDAKVSEYTTNSLLYVITIMTVYLFARRNSPTCRRTYARTYRRSACECALDARRGRPRPR